MLNMIIRKELLKKSVINNDNYIHSLYKMILIFISNSLLYIESFLIIYDKLPVSFDYTDLVYLVTCLLTDLVYSLTVKGKVIKKLFMKQKNYFAKNFVKKKNIIKLILLNIRQNLHIQIVIKLVRTLIYKAHNIFSV